MWKSGALRRNFTTESCQHSGKKIRLFHFHVMWPFCRNRRNTPMGRMAMDERFSDSWLSAVSDECWKLLPVQTCFQHNESTLCYVLGNDQIFLDSRLIRMVWLVFGRRACSATLSFMGFFFLLFISVFKLQTKTFLPAKRKVLEAILQCKLIQADCKLLYANFCFTYKMVRNPD